MIKINLLPVREERRRLGARQEMMFFVLVMVLVTIGLFYWYSTDNRKIKDVKRQIVEVEQDTERLKKIVKEVAKFKADKKVLDGKIAVINELKTFRQVQVHFLDELNKALPDQVWLEYYQQKAESLTLRGKSLSTDDIAGFMRKLEASAYFQNIRLLQTSQKEQKIGDRTVRVNDFGLRLEVIPSGGKG